MIPPRSVVIFDLDGTLIDSALGIAAALNGLGIAPHRVSVETVRDLVSLGAETLIAETLALPRGDVDAALTAFRARYASDPCGPEDLYPGIREALESLSAQEFALGVCTNKPQTLAEIVIDRLDLATLLPAVVGSTPGRPSKPDPRPLREAITLLEPGGRAILVGDSMVDAETARAAGIAFVHVTFGYGTIDPGMPCAASVNAAEDLPAVVASLLEAEHAL